MDFQHKFNEVTLMFSTRYLNECESFGRELFYDSMNSVAKDENSYMNILDAIYLVSVKCFPWITCVCTDVCIQAHDFIVVLSNFIGFNEFADS